MGKLLFQFGVGTFMALATTLWLVNVASAQLFRPTMPNKPTPGAPSGFTNQFPPRFTLLATATRQCNLVMLLREIDARAVGDLA